MTDYHFTQQVARYLIRRACRRLPGDIADERYREWTAELSAILSDPDTRHRAASALLYAADHARGASRSPRPVGLALVAGLTLLGEVWSVQSLLGNHGTSDWANWAFFSWETLCAVFMLLYLRLDWSRRRCSRSELP